MSQAAKTIADGSGAAVLAAVNAVISRIASMASGTSRPADIEAGEFWRETDNPGGGIHSIWQYDGASDVLWATLNTSTHALIFYSTTQSANDNSAKVATTAYADAQATAAAAAALANGRVRAWINWSGGGTTINASGNVTSITRHGAGDYTINLTSALPANAALFGHGYDVTSQMFTILVGGAAPTTTAVRVRFATIAGALTDPTNGYFCAIA